MQIILASAKIMNDKLKSVPDVSLSTPRFQNEADALQDMSQAFGPLPTSHARPR